MTQQQIKLFVQVPGDFPADLEPLEKIRRITELSQNARDHHQSIDWWLARFARVTR